MYINLLEEKYNEYLKQVDDRISKENNELKKEIISLSTMNKFKKYPILFFKSGNIKSFIKK